MNRKRKLVSILFVSVLLGLSGCSTGAETGSSAGAETSSTAGAAYKQIDQESAKEMMAKDDGHVIVDVRRQDEYDSGHIPGAILIPNESIESDPPEALPDLEQIILVYCRSGNRSKQASEKLASMGYTHIYEFGGINTWTGEIVTDEEDSGESGEAK